MKTKREKRPLSKAERKRRQEEADKRLIASAIELTTKWVAEVRKWDRQKAGQYVKDQF